MENGWKMDGGGDEVWCARVLVVAVRGLCVVRCVRVLSPCGRRTWGHWSVLRPGRRTMR